MTTEDGLPAFADQFPPQPLPGPLPRDVLLVARREALRAAVFSAERAVPAGVVLDRAAEFEAWLLRDLRGDDDGW